MLITTLLQYKRLLGHEEIRRIVGDLIHNPNTLSEITYETQVNLNQVPTVPIIKLARSEHVDSFFATGRLRLGTFKYFATFDHAEVGDKTEGSIIAVSGGPRSTTVAELAGGFDNYVFCCYAENVDAADVQSRFGYNAAYEITNVPGFSAAVSSALKATSKAYGLCVYRRDKVLVSIGTKQTITPKISTELLNLVGKAKHFIKPNIYAHQSEFRFIWQSAADVDVPLDIICPEAVLSCRRIDIT
jgi:hypothetical protein